jgi:ferredoxin
MPVAILPDISEQHCIGCALCVEICDGACIGVCPTKAIFWMRPMEYTPGQPIPLKKHAIFTKGWEEG